MTDKESNAGKFFTNYRFEYPKENVVVATSSFEEVPSNKKPLINVTMNGILRPSEEKVHEIKMIFDDDVPEKDTLASSYGTFVLCKSVYNARRIIKTAWDKEKSTLTIIIDLTREKVRPKRPAQFSFSIQINDRVPCQEVRDTFASLFRFSRNPGTKPAFTVRFVADPKDDGDAKTCPYGTFRKTYIGGGICTGTCVNTCQPNQLINNLCHPGAETCCNGNCVNNRTALYGNCEA